MNESYSSEVSNNGGTPAQKSPEARTLARIIEALEELDPLARKRVLQTASVFYAAEAPTVQEGGQTYSIVRQKRPGSESVASFTEDRTPSPKEFLLTKNPVTDIERMACLAYYLTHFRETPHFKTIDLSKLNTEAAQIKFSNATQAVDNATKAGLLAPAVRGNKQISAAGELYVQALPDRLTAKNALANIRAKKKGRKSNPNNENKK